ncbi:MAG: hypothetical protein WDO71_04340 [Bacteroidota bacterium]
MTAPYYRPLIAFPKTWTKGTNGLQNAEVLLITAKDSVELEQYRGKLKGKILIMNRTDTLKQTFKADAAAIQMKSWIKWLTQNHSNHASKAEAIQPKCVGGVNSFNAARDPHNSLIN